MSNFDPYHRWLGIPPKDQPPNHYRLLGIELFEPDLDVIEAAAEQRMLFVNQCATGPHADQSQRLLNQLSAARLCLLIPKQKSAYDAKLKLRLAMTQSVAELTEDEILPESEPVAAKSRTSSGDASSGPEPDVEEPLFEEEEVDFIPSAPGRKKGKAKAKPTVERSNKGWHVLLPVAVVLVIGLGLGAWKISHDLALAKAELTRKAQIAVKQAEEQKQREQTEREAQVRQREKEARELADAKRRQQEKADRVRLAALAKAEQSERERRDREERERKELVTNEEAPAEPNSPRPLNATAERTADEVQQAQRNWATHLNTTLIKKSVTSGIEFSLIPPGSFKIGDPPSETVSLANPLWVAKTEVTCPQWFRVMGFSPWLEKKTEFDDRQDYAATYITWKDAREFCRELSAKDGMKYRLLTDAEWEYACRAGTTTTFSFGDGGSELSKYGRYIDNSIKKQPHLVAKFSPNHFGLFDMHGNVREWCLDRFLNKLPEGENPVVTSAAGTDMVVRGGCWNDKPERCSSASRFAADRLAPNFYTGFRIACEFPDSTSEKPPVVAQPAAQDPPAVFVTTVERTEDDVQEAVKDWAAYLGTDVTEVNSIGMELVLIPPGKFKMGEENRTTASVTRPLWVSSKEVTQRQWWDVRLTAPWEAKNGKFKLGDNYAASNISWEDAQLFCKELSRIEKAEYRLLTEAEWEYACRAGTLTPFACGDGSELGDYGWFKDNASSDNEDYPHEVGQKTANAFGLFDMHGNVSEWCEDAYDAKLPGGENPLVRNTKSLRICRGGSWSSDSALCSSTQRGRIPLEEKGIRQGFRVARVVPVK